MGIKNLAAMWVALIACASACSDDVGGGLADAVVDAAGDAVVDAAEDAAAEIDDDDDDEVPTPNPCAGHVCPDHATCHQLEDGAPACRCDPGFYRDGADCLALEVDLCDEDPLAGVAFQRYLAGSFEAFYLPGTAAEDDIEAIVAARQDALESITAALDVVEDRLIEIDLTPSRLAAQAHGVYAGAAVPAEAWIMVLYLDDPQSYERVSYGHELTHALSYQLDPEHTFHAKFLEEGLAERFDQSGRDLHLTFAQDIRAHDRDPDDALRLDAGDVFGMSYAKAGSFVAQLFELDPDPAKWRALYVATRIGWLGDTPVTPDGKTLTPDVLEALLDEGLQQHYGFDLATFRAGWRERLTPYLAAEVVRPPAADVTAIEALLAARDAALGLGDAARYRATMEGFYCDVRSDAERAAVAEQMTAEAVATRSTLVEVYDMGIKNYRTALVVFEKAVGDAVTTEAAWVERYPLGWRIFWASDHP